MRRRWLQGFAAGCVSGAALVIAGPITLVAGPILWWLVLRGPRKLAAGSGGFFGFGVGMLLLLGQALLRCSLDTSCSQPDASPWFGIAAGFLILGLGIGTAAAEAAPTAPEPPA